MSSSDEESVPLAQRNAGKRKATRGSVSASIPGPPAKKANKQPLKFKKKAPAERDDTNADNDEETHVEDDAAMGFPGGLSTVSLRDGTPPALTPPALTPPVVDDMDLGTVRIVEPSGFPFSGHSGDALRIVLPAGSRRDDIWYLGPIMPSGGDSRPWRVAGSIPNPALAGLLGILVAAIGGRPAEFPFAFFEARLEFPYHVGTEPKNVWIMDNSNMATVILFDDRAVFLVHRKALPHMGLRLGGPPDDFLALGLVVVPFRAAELAGCDLVGAVSRFGTAYSRTSRNATLSNVGEFRREAILRAADLPNLDIAGRTFSVFGYPADMESDLLVSCLRRLGGIRISLSSSQLNSPGSRPDFVFVQHKTLREATTVARLMQWLYDGATRFYEFNLLKVGVPTGRFVRRMWPKEYGVLTWTYQGLMAAGYKGIEDIVRHIVSKIPQRQPLDEVLAEKAPTPPFIMAVSENLMARIGKAARNQAEPQTRGHALRILEALRLAHKGISMRVIAGMWLPPAWDDVKFVEIPENTRMVAADEDEASRIARLYMTSRRYECGRFCVIGAPDDGKNCAFVGLQAFGTVQEFLHHV